MGNSRDDVLGFQSYTREDGKRVTSVAVEVAPGYWTAYRLITPGPYSASSSEVISRGEKMTEKEAARIFFRRNKGRYS